MEFSDKATLINSLGCCRPLKNSNLPGGAKDLAGTLFRATSFGRRECVGRIFPGRRRQLLWGGMARYGL